MAVWTSVATVISQSEVAFAAGSRDGVAAGDIATVLREIEVNDPQTQEPLGTVQRPLINFEIGEVQDNLSVGEVIDTVQADASDLFGVFATQHKRVAATASNDRRTVVVVPGQGAVIRHPDEKSE